MIWGCMLWEGAVMACQIDGIMDGDLYIKMLDDELGESLEYYGKTTEDIIFQQNNDSKHTSKKVKKWLGEHDYEVMLWPCKSVDLNPIEHLWCLLKRKLKSYAEEPKGIEELWKRVQEQWDNIDNCDCQKLIESMARRVEGVMRARGGYRKY
jgi:hypothetical protein